ncbi:MAG TPA: c-type cytochrome [Caulobacteraceae bacterium]|nr:c-type cytochrome [Caulobacteraceae bacterium]
MRAGWKRSAPLVGLAALGLIGLAGGVGAQPVSWWGGHGAMMGGDWVRHRYTMMSGVPAPYDTYRNPLPKDQAVIRHGAAVYAANCATCHGDRGHGDGPAAANLNPRPADLAWISAMPMGRWDPFMYWTIAEGGARLDTAMPSFKTSLSKNDIWSVIAYVQSELPQDWRHETSARGGRRGCCLQ